MACVTAPGCVDLFQDVRVGLPGGSCKFLHSGECPGSLDFKCFEVWLPRQACVEDYPKKHWCLKPVELAVCLVLVRHSPLWWTV